MYNYTSEIEKTNLHNPARRSRFAGLGRLVYHYRTWVIILWGLLIVVSLAFTPALESALKETGAVYEAGQAYRTEQLLQQELKVMPNPLILVFQSQQTPKSEIDQAEVERLLSLIRNLPLVSSVVSAAEHPDYRSANGQTQYSVIQLHVKDHSMGSAIDHINQILTQHTPHNLKTFLSGKPVVDLEVQRISKADLGRVELWVLPLTLFALLFVFGSLVTAAMPVAMGITTVSVTFGILYLITLKLSVSIFALNLTTMLGLGLGIDYSLLIVSRFREELQSASVEQALAQTLDTAGRSVFFSGLTVCIGLVCLMLFPILLLQSFGIAGAVVVLLSVAAALTLLPALLGCVGHRIAQDKSVLRFAEAPRVWAAIARMVTRHSLVAVIVVLMMVMGLTSPFLAARFGLGNADILPESVSARQGVEVLQQAFTPGEPTPIFLAVRTRTPGSRILSEHYIATLYNLVTKLKADVRIASVNSLVNLNPQLTLDNYQQLYRQPTLILEPKIAAAVKQFSSDSTTLVVIKSRTISNDAASRSLVQDLRKLNLDGLQVQVAGQTASDLDTIKVIYQRFPSALTTMMIATFIVLCFLLSSVILPLKAIVMNLLSIGATFGSLVFIFQQGHGQTWLKFTPVGYLDILLPVVLFYVLFGLSMDYEVFLLTRIKEAYDRSSQNSLSIIEGLRNTGSIITSAALLMIIVTSAFVSSSIIFVKALGFGSAIAIMIDATLIRTILVPATMHLMGQWNWWSPTHLISIYRS